MKHTGIYATESELNDLKTLAERGWRHGDVMIVSSILEGIEKDKATVDAEKVCHELALKHGLPEIEGHYGITNNGEFVCLE